MRKHGFQRRVLSFGFTVVAGVALAGAAATPSSAGEESGSRKCGFAMVHTTPPRFHVDPQLRAPIAANLLPQFDTGVDDSDVTQFCS